MKNNKITNWIQEQTALNVAQFDQSLCQEKNASNHWTRDVVGSYNRICKECNYLAAVQLVDWSRYIGDRSTVLDLAGGSGWLTGHLSKIHLIEKIFFLDSSRHYIEHMMPNMVNHMDGDLQKVEAIEGLFYPLLFKDASIDVVVVSSALHHAENLISVLKEIKRILKKGGTLFILNETPLPNIRYSLVMMKRFISIFTSTIAQKYVGPSPTISANGILYDPLLGDRIYPLWYWINAIELAGLSLSHHMRTDLTTVKGQKGIFLQHFVCTNNSTG